MALRVAARCPLLPCGSLRTRAWTLLAFMAMLLFAQPGQAQSGSLEQRVKAAFLFNFTRFVDWPPEAFATADTALDICVLADDPIASTVDETVRGKSANSRPLSVRRVQPGADLRGCKILYLNGLEPGRVRELVGALRGQSVLTVGDTPGFLDAGGMIRFLIVDGKVRFEINRGAAEGARLALSSQLLSVAHAVVRGSGG